MKNFFLLAILALNLFAFDTNFKTFKSDFTQTVKSINSSINYEGYFVLTPSKAFWSYERPTNKQIYINNKDVTIIENDLEQVIYTSLDKIPNLSIIFKNAKKKSDTEYETQYDGILYKIILQNDEIKQVSYKDDFDNTVIIELKNQQRNISLNNDIFKARIPSNYDVLK
ncbi:LolA-like outer membrane lipoprotein chaperone [uncultured Campylobacter sp.]|uniref:LolA-like outer membrane lipoprotein chaperone n=1 Tax=uncultured Campylobacter sp. TaxID=218934 RepID=UPI0026131F0E|nr:LolA-like outer membrane lipoprotein chaperone [uncultured Campylobacter sp.]